MSLKDQILAELAKGSSTAPDLAKEIGVERTHVWRSLRRLERNRLVKMRVIWSQGGQPHAWELR